ncbi:MAG: hypothetical protein HYR64_03660 [Fimbriimonas ginsengisoli]|uniref:Uncharacterized protein n=1 Tax=Fimbriimonas ginsengisoli TaxID=1005039 RepID=A0A931LRK9_FIMGI|nr:hypothetical protein [Fimbriimonas ginsengisoli]
MPVTFTFDIEDASVADPNDRTRIQVAFLRFGWEHVGGSAWRYPKFGADEHPSEDWLNHVVPALMYFRSLVEHSNMRVTKFTLDAHSEAGYRTNGARAIGQPIAKGAAIVLCAPNLAAEQEEKLSENRLKRFVSDTAGSLA